MSSLIFWTDETQALVATDTLGTSPDGRAVRFTTKAFIVPHLKLIIAGTGAGGFLGKWFIRINDGLVVRGIDHLNYHAPRILASIWPGVKQEFSTTDITATVYHFGFSEKTGLMRSFAYRSTNDFVSEEIAYGLGLKPEFSVPEKYELPRDFKKMMDAQRAIQAALPKEETRLYIGGEIVIHRLTNESFAAYTLDRFEDYASDEAAIYENFRASKEQAP